MTIDESTIKLLRELRKNGRSTVSQLSNRLSLSRGNIYTRMKKLRDSGTLLGFTAVVDPRQLGLDIVVIVLIETSPVQSLDWPRLREHFATKAQVEYVAFISGEADVIIKLRTKNLTELREFVFDEIRAQP